uniref:ADAMTS-like 7 n=1 Tax=Cyprinus carpio TaxID=7962 RepID=A0A8C1QEV0_CYPCA
LLKSYYMCLLFLINSCQISQPMLINFLKLNRLIVDVCGVCAGDGSSCELFSGTLFLSVLSVGYHKILDIPAGAQRIKVQETQKTRNYLALKTATGESVINGDWVIDRPGHFYAAGTQLTYKRPNEIRSRAGESITAPGPTNQELHLFVRDHSYCMTSQNCSRQVLFGCVERATQTSVPGDLCSYTSHPGPQVEECQSQPCPTFWDVGEWSECSKTCGPGFQNRQVICQQTQGHHGNSTVVVATSLCDSTEMPEMTTVCQLKICSEWQIRSDWTECSVPCGVGQRRREVVCVDNLGDIVSDEECNMALRPQDLQNCDKGVCASSWFYSLWSDRCSADCAEGRRSRSVVCMMSQTNSLPLDNCDDEDKPDELVPCDLGPCTQRLEWYSGPWGQCSSECGNGTQSRGVVCVVQNNGQLEVTSDDRCSHLPRPLSAQTCFLKSCGAQWYMTEWSSCSRSCDGGFRVREVRCLQDDLTTSHDCDPALEPVKQETCNTHTCTEQIDESCRDMYYNCVVVVQACLCVYSYYRTTCCASCSRVIQRDTLRRIR